MKALRLIGYFCLIFVLGGLLVYVSYRAGKQDAENGVFSPVQTRVIYVDTCQHPAIVVKDSLTK